MYEIITEHYLCLLSNHITLNHKKNEDIKVIILEYHIDIITYTFYVITNELYNHQGS